MRTREISPLAFLLGLALGWYFRKRREDIISFLEENFIAIVIAIIILALFEYDWKVKVPGGFFLGFGIGFSL